MDDISGGKMNLAQLRNLIRQYVDNHLYSTALYWADKACSISNWELEDVIWLAQTMYLNGQYRRATNLLTKLGLPSRSRIAKYLIAKCHAECREWDSVIDVLESNQIDVSSINTESFDPSKVEAVINGRKIESAICLLKGMAYEGSGNSLKHLALDAYKEALKLDVYCFEAFNLLTSHNMMTAQEETELIESLPFNNQCSMEEANFVRLLYVSKTKSYSKPVNQKLPDTLVNLNKNQDVIVSTAVRHLNNCNTKACYKLTSAVLLDDEYHESCLPVHISCLFELKKKNELYLLASSLVASYPKKAISWHAIGAYYLLNGKNETARQYFGKSTSIDRVYAPAWLGFAHSFANEGEHDQAISAYFTASELMPGSHLPFFYLGLEYITTNNIKLAKHFLKEALVISPDDPFIKHELGTIAYHNGNFKAAKKYFDEAFKRVESINGKIIPEDWEPLLNNLGHTCRKLGEYENSLHYYKTALTMISNNSSTFSSIGLAYSYLQNYKEAVSAFHNALSINRDDTISQQLLVYALNAYADQQVKNLEIIYIDKILHGNEMANNDSTVQMEDASMLE